MEKDQRRGRVEPERARAVGCLEIALEDMLVPVWLAVNSHPPFKAAGAVTRIVDDDQIVGRRVDADPANVTAGLSKRNDLTHCRSRRKLDDADECRPSVTPDENVAFIVDRDRVALAHVRAGQLFRL